MNAYLNRLISGGENQEVDFKFKITDSKKIARSLVAFANTDGGKLLLGVKDNGKIAGVRSDEEYYMIEAAATMYCKPAIDFSVKTWNHEGKTVLEIIIPKSKDEYHLAKSENGKWLAYIRSGDQNLLANNVLLKVWKKKKKSSGILIQYKGAEDILLSYLKQNKSITLNRFCKIAKLTRGEAEDILANLISLGIIEIDFTEKQVYYSLNTSSNEI